MYNKLLITAFCLSICITACKTTKQLTEEATNQAPLSHTDEILVFQDELNTFYLDPEKSPLGKANIPAFEAAGGHQFYEINSKFRIEATLDTSQVKKDIGFETSTARVAMYDKIGTVTFELDGKSYQLSIFESHYTRGKEEYKDHLFLPYKDLTNGSTTYGGGRYIDLKKQDSNTLIIDFNKSYNPYCAYSDNYSCPVPPVENFLDVEILAGIKLQK